MNMCVGSIVLLATALVLGPALSSSEATGRRPLQDVVLYGLNELTASPRSAARRRDSRGKASAAHSCAPTG